MGRWDTHDDIFQELRCINRSRTRLESSPQSVETLFLFLYGLQHVRQPGTIDVEIDQETVENPPLIDSILPLLIPLLSP